MLSHHTPCGNVFAQEYIARKMVVTDNKPQLIFDKDKKRAAQRQMNAEVFTEHGMNRNSNKYATKKESTDTKQRGLRDRK